MRSVKTLFRQGRKRVHCFEANLFRTLRNKFHQHLAEFCIRYDKIFWCVCSWFTVYTLETATPPVYSVRSNCVFFAYHTKKKL